MSKVRWLLEMKITVEVKHVHRVRWQNESKLVLAGHQSGFFWLYWQQMRGEVARNSIKGTFRSPMSQMKDAIGISSDMPACWVATPIEI